MPYPRVFSRSLVRSRSADLRAHADVEVGRLGPEHETALRQPSDEAGHREPVASCLHRTYLVRIPGVEEPSLAGSGLISAEQRAGGPCEQSHTSSTCIGNCHLFGASILLNL